MAGAGAGVPGSAARAEAERGRPEAVSVTGATRVFAAGASARPALEGPAASKSEEAGSRKKLSVGSAGGAAGGTVLDCRKGMGEVREAGMLSWIRVFSVGDFKLGDRLGAGEREGEEMGVPGATLAPPEGNNSHSEFPTATDGGASADCVGGGGVWDWAGDRSSPSTSSSDSRTRAYDFQNATNSSGLLQASRCRKNRNLQNAVNDVRSCPETHSFGVRDERPPDMNFDGQL
jgi:hypothetical protein